jgi:FdhE protein
MPRLENELAIWDARIRRASELASSYPFASEGLRFYQRLARFQKSLYAEIKAECGNDKRKRRAGTLRDEFDAFILLPRFAGFVSALEEIAPPPLARSAHELRSRGSGRWQGILQEFWERDSAGGNLQPPEELVSWLFLQPYAEYLADHSEWSPREGMASTCALCGSKPQVGALRPEGDGGKRSLICSLCAAEWDYGRIACAACGESDPHKLAVYSAKEFDSMRVEACETCRRYIKTADLTKDGHAVPFVDELAIIPLDLWAVEHGYHKIHPNLLGI